MRVLVYENRKADPVCWDASTPEKKGAAVLCLFRHLDRDWEFYTGLDEYPKDLEEAKKKLETLEMTELPWDHALYRDYVDKKVSLEKSIPELERGVSQYDLLIRAREGDVQAAERLLYLRRDYELEFWQFIDVIDPLTEKD